MKNIICAVSIAIAGMGVAANAQEISGTVTVTPFKVEGLVTGSRHKIDKAFETKYKVKVPQGFSFISPRNKQQKVYIKEAPGGDAPIKLFFTTFDDQVQSLIQFVPFTADMIETEARLKGLQGILKQAFMSPVTDKDQARINVLHLTKVGKYPAIELIGNYKDPVDGAVVRQVVAIPHPESENGVIVIVNALARNLKMPKAEDILETSASRAIGTFKFLDE